MAIDGSLAPLKRSRCTDLVTGHIYPTIELTELAIAEQLKSGNRLSEGMLMETFVAAEVRS